MRSLLAFALLLPALGCTSGSKMTGSSAGCEDTCQTIVGVGCPNDDQASCVSECQAELGQYDACASQMGAVMDCFLGQAPMYCGSNGKARVQAPPGVSAGAMMQALCPSQVGAFSGCIACEPDPSDSPSETCLKTSCCSESQAFFADPDWANYQSCMDSCYSGTTTCMETCKAEYPGVGAKFDAIMSCGLSNGC